MVRSLVLLAAVCLAGPSNGQTIRGEQGQLELVLERSFELKENLGLLGRLETSGVTDLGELVIGTPQGTVVYLYDQQGNQVRRIGAYGRGPGEYALPIEVRVYGSDVYVFDGSELKIIQYDSGGRFIREFRSGTEAINNFEVLGDDLFLYLVGGFRAEYIGVMSLETGRLSSVHSVRTNTHDVLTRWGTSGGTTTADGLFYYVSPAELTLRAVDPETRAESSFDFPDPEFVQKGVDYAIRDTERPLWRQYYDANSRHTGLFSTEDYLLIETENERADSRSGLNRGSAITVLDRKSRQYQDTIRMDHALREAFGAPVRAVASDGRVYFIRETSSEGGSELDRTVFVFKIRPTS